MLRLRASSKTRFLTQATSLRIKRAMKQFRERDAPRIFSRVLTGSENHRGRNDDYLHSLRVPLYIYYYIYYTNPQNPILTLNYYIYYTNPQNPIRTLNPKPSTLNSKPLFRPLYYLDAGVGPRPFLRDLYVRGIRASRCDVHISTPEKNLFPLQALKML